MLYPKFSELLSKHLVEKDRSQAWLSEKLKINPSTVARWIQHHTRPKSPEVIIRIADLLGIFNRGERQELLASAEYGYIEGEHARLIRNDTRLNILDSPRDLPRSPYLVPSIPAQGIFGRDDTLRDAIKMLRLDSDQGNLPIAFQGMGGIGKTTLATALGRESSIQNHFSDGILWVALGPNPVIRLLLNDWGNALGIDIQAEPNEKACRERLQSVLLRRRALLIIDDVWELSHAQYFLVGGAQCRTVITTRETPIAYGFSTITRTLKVDILKSKDALALLASLAPNAVGRDAQNSRLLCKRLEYLPLAITLAGRLLATEADVPSRVNRLLNELISERSSRLKLIQEEGRIGINDNSPVSLHAILGMSVARLTTIDQKRFAMLSVFGSEPLTWQTDAAAYVWDCSVDEAEPTISRFVQRGLITYRTAHNDYWMHALLSDYAAEMMEQQADE